MTVPTYILEIITIHTISLHYSRVQVDGVCGALHARTLELALAGGYEGPGGVETLVDEEADSAHLKLM